MRFPRPKFPRCGAGYGLAHETGPRADPVLRQRQTRRRAKRNDPSLRPHVPTTHSLRSSRKRTNDAYPVHSFISLLADLATVGANITARQRHASIHHDHHAHPTAAALLDFLVSVAVAGDRVITAGRYGQTPASRTR